MTERVRVEVDGESRGLRRAVRDAASDIRGLGVLTRRESRATAADVDRSSRRITSALRRPRGAAEGLGNSMLRLRLVAAALTFAPAIKGLSALAAALLATASAVGPAAGGLAAVPSVLSAIAQGASAASLASQGVGEAIKASLDAQTGATRDATAALSSHQTSVEAVREAKRALTRAEDEERQALGQLDQARQDATRTLADMRLEAERSRLTEERAVLALAEARRELRRASMDPDSTGLDFRDAELRVAEAEHDLRETRTESRRARRDYDRAQRGGVKGMPEMVAAQQAYRDAQTGSTEAARELAAAQRESAEAVGAQTAAVTKQQEAFKDLSPAARRFVDTVLELKPAYDQLRATAAEGLFPGVEAGLKDVEKLLPLVDRIVGKSAEALGAIAADAGAQISSPRWQRDLEVFGERNVVTIERMGDVGLHLADAFRHVMVEADPLIDWLTRSAVLWARNTEEEARAARKSGELASFFDRARFALERLFSIAGNVGSALGNIFHAGREEGQGLLVDIDRLTARFDRWTESAKGQDALKEWFRDGRETLRELGDAIEGLRDRFRELRDDGRSASDALIITLSEAIAKAIGHAATKVAQQIPTLVEAFVRGWLAAPAWGKFLITGWILKKLGGAGALKTVGQKIAGGIAGGIAGQSLSAKVAGFVGGRGATPAMPLYVWQVNPGAGGGKGPGGVAGGGSRIPTAVKVVGGVTLVGAGTYGFGKLVQHVFEGHKPDPIATGTPTRRRDPRAAGRDNAALPMGWMPERVVGTRMREGVRPDESIVAAAAGAEQLRKRIREITRDIKKMSEESGGSIKGLSDRAAENFKRIRDSIGLHTREGRELARRNFREAAEGIAQAMQRGRGSTREGMSAIEQLIRTHSRGGKEGLKRNLAEAQDVIARTMRRGGEITDRGLRLIRRLMVEELKLYGVDPKDALHAVKQGGTRDDTFRVLGHARGGMVQYGQPGEKGRDSILTRIAGQDIMVGPGEVAAVLTGDQQAELNARLADVGGLPGLFKTFNRPHYMARGGWVGKSPSGLNAAIKSIGQWAMNKYGASASSTLRAGDDGHHGVGAAVDLTSGNMLEMARGIDRAFRPKLLELIHTPLGYSIDNGQQTAPFAQEDHYDHVHAAAMGAALAALKKIGRVEVSGRDSPLRDIVQRTLDKARAAANRHLESAVGGMGGDIPHFTGTWVEVLEQIAADKGWSAGDWKELVDRESGGNPAAVNPDSGAFGLGQFLGSTKDAYAKHGAASTNPVEQIHAMAKYIADRYVTPTAALRFHDANNWYQRGGIIGQVDHMVQAARGLLTADTGMMLRHAKPKRRPPREKFVPKRKKKGKQPQTIVPGLFEEGEFNRLTTMAEDLEGDAANVENLFMINPDQLLQLGGDGKPVLGEDGKPVVLDELTGGERSDLIARWQAIRGVHAGQRLPLAERLRGIAQDTVTRLNAAIKKKAEEWRENMRTIRRLRREIDKLLEKIEQARKDNAGDRDTIARIRGRRGPLTQGERNRVDDLRGRIAGRERKIDNWTGDIERDRSAIRRYRRDNVVVFGKEEPDPEQGDAPSDSSIIGRLAADRARWSGLAGDMVQQLRPAGIPAQVVGADQQIAALIRGENTGPLVDGTSQRDAERAGLLAQALAETRRSLALSEAHFAVFRSMGTVMGSFSHGTREVPRTGLYVLHQGEGVTPAPTGPYPPVNRAAGGGVPKVDLTLNVRTDQGQLIEVVDARVDGKIAQHKTTVERRSRTLARGPGRP